jgi:REP element-mobilizing transposase RayT
MPEHFHLLINEPEIGTPSTVMQVLKQRTAHALLPKKRRASRLPLRELQRIIGCKFCEKDW